MAHALEKALVNKKHPSHYNVKYSNNCFRIFQRGTENPSNPEPLLIV
jgi:hypothetical protein